jgi:hypothetical protein
MCEVLLLLTKKLQCETIGSLPFSTSPRAYSQRAANKRDRRAG